MAAGSELEHETEAARVESWRLHVLIEAGCSLRYAERLAAADTDLHQLVWMLECGCDERTICRIVL